jgi:hypothetical protein
MKGEKILLRWILREIGWGGITGFTWLRIWSSGAIL